MIIPYFNCLVVPYSTSTAKIDPGYINLLSEYFNQYFDNHFNKNQCLSIYISSFRSLTKTCIKDSLLEIIQTIIKTLCPSVYRLNNSYTLKQDLKMMHEALGQITVIDNTNQKGTAKIQNLSLLKLYYSNFKKQGEMKQFLKELLIEQISKEKRTITYRKASEIQSIIRLMQDQIKGQIAITYQQENMQNLSIVNVILIDQKLIGNLQYVLALVQKKYKINTDINVKITQSFMNQILKKQSQEFIFKMANSLIIKKCDKYIDQFNNLETTIVLAANLKSVLMFGLKLAQQQKIIKQQFAKFVQEMNLKYSKIAATYLNGFTTFLNCNQQKKKYKQFCYHQKKLNKYIFGFKQCINYNKIKKQKLYYQCKIIQNGIRAFLQKKIAEKNVISYFLHKKQKQSFIFQEYYNRIIQIYNKNQLNKLSKHNKFKYGFSCCTVILLMNNHSGYSNFDPHHFLKLLETENKHQQLFVKIHCNQFNIKLTSIEGKSLTLGHNLSNLYSQKYDSSQLKQNLSNNISFSSNSQTTTFRNNSYSKNTKRLTNSNSMKSLYSVTSSKSSACDSKLLFDEIRSQSYRKQQIQQIVKCQNFQIKLNEKGQLLGRGSNKFGQLGLSTKSFSENYVLILPNQKIKLFSSLLGHTVAVTINNKIFYFGKSKGKLCQSSEPIEFLFQEKIIIKQVLCSIDDTFLLTDRNKVYSINQNQYIRINKSVELQFDNFYLVRTGTFNLQIVYLVAYWTNSLDKVHKKNLYKYLTNQQKGYYQTNSQSLLIDSQMIDQKGFNSKRDIAQLSDILEESGFIEKKF